MVEIGMTIKQCCDHANLMPTLGTLQEMTEAKALRYKFADRFSVAQLEAYEITKKNGKYSVSAEKANTGVMVKFEDSEIAYFKNFIQKWDENGTIGIDNVDLYKKINEVVLENYEG